MRKRQEDNSKRAKQEEEAQRLADIKTKVSKLMNAKGKRRSVEENRMLLMCLFELVGEGMSVGEAKQRTSKLLHVGHTTLNELVEHFNDTGEVDGGETGQRGYSKEEGVKRQSLKSIHVAELPPHPEPTLAGKGLFNSRYY
jgi:hypothetical protein